MPRDSKSLEARLTAVAARFAAEIAHLVRQDLVEEIALIVGSNGARRGKPRGRKEKHTFPPHCLYPRCAGAHLGPRFSFMCGEHRDVSKREKRRLGDAWKERRAKQERRTEELA